jgi:hypothetical protein
MALKTTKREGEKRAITSLKKKVTRIEKDVNYIKRMLQNPANAMMVLSGQAQPGEKVVTESGIGIYYARFMKQTGRIDELKESGMSDEEIADLDKDFYEEPKETDEADAE